MKIKPKPAFLTIFILLQGLVLYNLAVLSKDMISGDYSARDMIPTPLNGFMRVPDNAMMQAYKAEHRLAFDFAQVYFPARELSSAYTTESLDPAKRPSLYAPTVLAVCAISLCKLDYGYASFGHMSIQMMLFFLSFVYAFKLLRQDSYIWPAIMLVNVCMFLTPVGLSWFERGQFSLYVSLSYLWLILGILDRNAVHMFLSGLFAYIKWTSFPFIFVVLVLFMFSSKSLQETKQNTIMVLTFIATIVILFCLYPDSGIEFVLAAMDNTFGRDSTGISLLKLAPQPIVRAMPFVLMVVGFMHLKKYNKDFVLLVPWLIGSAMILITYPTVAYDYRVPVLFCFIPLVIHWSEHPLVRDHTIGRFIKLLFLLFVVVASFSNHINDLSGSSRTIIWMYLVCSSIILVLPLVHLKTNREEAVDD